MIGVSSSSACEAPAASLAAAAAAAASVMSSASAGAAERRLSVPSDSSAEAHSAARARGSRVGWLWAMRFDAVDRTHFGQSQFRRPERHTRAADVCRSRLECRTASKCSEEL
eukprot:274409-Chlamydomonas_euryale.AAC.1